MTIAPERERTHWTGFVLSCVILALLLAVLLTAPAAAEDVLIFGEPDPDEPEPPEAEAAEMPSPGTPASSAACWSWANWPPTGAPPISATTVGPSSAPAARWPETGSCAWAPA